MTISIPRGRRVCSACGAQKPPYSVLGQPSKDKVWNRADLCPSCFTEQKSPIFWKRAQEEKKEIHSVMDYSSLIQSMKEYINSQDSVDLCTGLLLAEFLVRLKQLRRVGSEGGHFRLRESEGKESDFVFDYTDFSREVRVEANKRLTQLLQPN